MRFFKHLLPWALLSLLAGYAQADALIQSKAVSATTIAQYYIDEEGVRLELEIGMDGIDGFRNLLPDEPFQKMGFGDQPWPQRLQQFVTRDMPVLVADTPLPARLTQISPSRRVLRDPINGTPLPVQDEAPEVLRATLQYTFPENTRPDELRLGLPPGMEIGFVAYHQGVAVNDYRYLGAGYLLQLDWQDPWYSKFSSRSLQRQYAAPMSGFIYVEPFEVRKEIIVRPKDLQRWVDLGLAGLDNIPVEIQGQVKERVAAFLEQHQQITIDGEVTPGILDSVNFLERTLTSSRVIDPPEVQDINAAIIGTIFVYPRRGLPEKVTMDWDLWDERIQRVPVSAVDQAGPLPSYLEPDAAQLLWQNFLTQPVIPTLTEVEAPVEPWRTWIYKSLPLLYALCLASGAWLIARLKQANARLVPACTFLLVLTATLGAIKMEGSNQPQSERAGQIVADLLHNIYRAFDYREESEIYDVLAQSVGGELLTDIYLETKRSLVLANQGGARAKVKSVELADIVLKSDQEDDQFTAEAQWTVRGSVGHWGHVHQRNNRYQALLVIGVDAGQWKLKEMTVLQEERL